MTSDIDGEPEPSTLARRQLGRLLRDRRDQTGMSLAKAAELAEISQSALQRIEAGRTRKVRVLDVRSLCGLYGVQKRDAARMVQLARQATTTSWYTAFSGLYSDDAFNLHAELTAEARHMVSYQEIVFALVQTPSYARALISRHYAGEPMSLIDRKVDLRMQRRSLVLRKSDPASLELLLHESALHRSVGSRRTMAGQMRYLAEISKLPNISIRIHPYRAGCAFGMMHGPFWILDFGTDPKGQPEEPPLVYIEGSGKADLFMEAEEDVARFQTIAAAIRKGSHDEDKSRDLLRQVAKEYAR
ncbi:XRE family transcriptional regulator [Nocardia panacis]|uniref:XRE family transcriptional regulator n=1 Tax=Nocardia panacis TaxID=2340916 RepID=A0A3A4L9G4_9NOCA|nr:helix-turn-helix transcriptional regulator [Nocardia panacis]RJO79912.1 XRE family transcriptional regulator [Nocardia panacis]